jgi:hypothetical protein
MKTKAKLALLSVVLSSFALVSCDAMLEVIYPEATLKGAGLNTIHITQIAVDPSISSTYPGKNLDLWVLPFAETADGEWKPAFDRKKRLRSFRIADLASIQYPVDIELPYGRFELGFAVDVDGDGNVDSNEPADFLKWIDATNVSRQIFDFSKEVSEYKGIIVVEPLERFPAIYYN